MSHKLINVHIGEVKTGTNATQLHTILGSCIGIAFLWPKREIYGLAHCLLPKAPEGYVETLNAGKSRRHSVHAGRYVDQAIDSLTQLMSITDYRDIRAVVAGGANMTLPDSQTPEKLIGHQNVTSVLRELEKRKVIIVQEDTGGYVGRKVSIDCMSGEYDIQLIPRMAA